MVAPLSYAPNLIAAHADSASSISQLRLTSTIRSRATALLARARAGESAFFAVHDAALPMVAQRVAEVTLQRYPDLAIPYHSRWRHFEAGGADRLAALNERLGAATPAERARVHIDLAVVSVLLDAGAGPQWQYEDTATGQRLNRSEGLGVASFNAFMQGLFSSNPARPLQVDAAGLLAITPSQLGTAFQVNTNNPLVGLEGRAALLRRLGEVIATQPAVFGTGTASGLVRPGHVFDHLQSVRGAATSTGTHWTLAATDILDVVLAALSPVWPAQNTLIDEAGQPIALGDCWRHSAVPGQGIDAGWMPFHKLSQWLTYSLLEPFEWAGVAVTGLDALTGLPEYRNGGLLIDAGVLAFKAPALAQQTWHAGDELIVEWRALTVALLDELAPLVRTALGRTAEQMPLACVLEGGTWATGRVWAQQLRGGTPPLNIQSDGTVF
jgi:Protein of unknown function (DUF1688)